MAANRLFVDKMEAQLDAWALQFKELRLRAAKRQNAVIAEGHLLLEELKPREKAIRKLIKQVRMAGDEGTEEIRMTLETAWKDLRAAYEKAKAFFAPPPPPKPMKRIPRATKIEKAPKAPIAQV